MPRDHALFDKETGNYVTNALLSDEEVERMERDGFRCVVVRDLAWENLPAFRGRRYVGGEAPFRRKWPGR